MAANRKRQSMKSVPDDRIIRIIHNRGDLFLFVFIFIGIFILSKNFIIIISIIANADYWQQIPMVKIA